MALPPSMFAHTLPAVYGPIDYPVQQLQIGLYYINGYGVEFQGTPREIAKQILIKFTIIPKDDIQQYHIGPFYLDMRAEPRVCFCMNAKPNPETLDVTALSEAITEELKSLMVLLPFS